MHNRAPFLASLAVLLTALSGEVAITVASTGAKSSLLTATAQETPGYLLIMSYTLFFMFLITLVTSVKKVLLLQNLLFFLYPVMSL